VTRPLIGLAPGCDRTAADAAALNSNVPGTAGTGSV